MMNRYFIAVLFLFCLCFSPVVVFAAPITVPPSLVEGDTYRIAFVTTGTTTAESSDIATYNTFVTNQANLQPELAALGTTWTAVGSTSAVDARDNTETNPFNASHADIPIFLLDGTKLVDSNADLWDGTIDNQFRVRRDGTIAPTTGGFQWTGTDDDGKSASGGFDQFALGTTNGSHVMVGNNFSSTGNNDWVEHFVDTKNNTKFMYAISGELTVPSPYTMTMFGQSAYNVNTAAMDVTLGVTGYEIEDFEDAILLPGLSPPVHTSNPWNNYFQLSEHIGPGAWDGSKRLGLVFQGNVTFTLPPGVRSVGVGFGFIGRSGQTVQINGRSAVDFSVLNGFVFHNNYRNGYLRIDAVDGAPPISTVTFSEYAELYSLDHLALKLPDADGDGFSTLVDCDDTNPAINPAATEICDGIDNDCDGSIDQVDNDGDGVSLCNGDCDDANATVYPGAEELCDGIDNDCDGSVDEGLISTYYADQDGDGYGNLNNVTMACEQPAGYVLDNSDCNDNDSGINPEASEICDGLDNDCDGEVDEGLTFDADADGHTSLDSCEGSKDDCDDTNADVFPGAPELCDGLDNDCDGEVDEGLTFDADEDGHTTPDSCEGTRDDCDDTDANVYPGAPELCDDLDNDCDGTIDEGLITVTTKDHSVALDATGSAVITPADVDDGSTACGVAILSVSPSSFDCDDIGTNTVTLTVTDDNGNSDTATATVTVQDATAPTVTATLVPVKVKKKHGCFRVEFSATDNCDVADMSAELNGYDVTNGQIVELKKKKKFKVKIKGEGSHDDDSKSHDDGSSGGRHCHADVKFEGPDFALTVTATDESGNEGTATDDFVFPSKHDGHSHDDSSSGHKKK